MKLHLNLLQGIGKQCCGVSSGAPWHQDRPPDAVPGRHPGGLHRFLFRRAARCRTGSLLAGAFCVYGPRYRARPRRCDCGFRCVRDRAAAEALLWTAEHRAAVLLDVMVPGDCIRFEHGFRYARRRVRTATGPLCVRGAGRGPCRRGLGQDRAGERRPPRARRAPARGRPSHRPRARLAAEGLRGVVAPRNGPGAVPPATTSVCPNSPRGQCCCRRGWTGSRAGRRGSTSAVRAGRRRGRGGPPGYPGGSGTRGGGTP